jgi:hypothetical protein
VTARSFRLAVILLGIGAGLLALLSWTQPWFTLTLVDGQELEVAGQSAAPALSALALASLALSAALTIAGRVIRILLGVVETGIGVLLLIVVLAAVFAPVAASRQVVTDATAVSGPDSIAALVVAVATTPWPWLGLAAGLCAVIAGLGVVFGVSRWPAATRKYDTTTTDTRDDSTVGAWDALSGGNDPTG